MADATTGKKWVKPVIIGVVVILIIVGVWYYVSTKKKDKTVKEKAAQILAEALPKEVATPTTTA